MSSSKFSTENQPCGLEQLQQTYADLPEIFYSRVAISAKSAQVPAKPEQQPGFCIFNQALAHELGFDPAALQTKAGLNILAGSSVGRECLAHQPIALAYAGHQFGHFTILGDGRALLLGEHLAPGGRRVDIQLKGAGATPYARRGDGLAALAPMLREYLISEAMHALGIPTTRSLAVVSTGTPVYRERPLPGAVLTRVAASHIRVGTFQFAALHGPDKLKALADYTIKRHYLELRDTDNPYLAFLNAVIQRQAALIAQWMLVGFVHGVMNTDNVSIAGETIGYGPCAFLDRFDPATVFSSIDQQGRYAYANQPAIGHWNLCRFAESLLPLIDTDEAQALALAQEAISGYAGHYDACWRNGLARKLGFAQRSLAIDRLAEDFLALVQSEQADFTQTFWQLTQQQLGDAVYQPWLSRWQALVGEQPGGLHTATEIMQQSNPVVIPRNHLVQAALDQAEQGDMQAYEQLLAVLQNPYDPAHSQTIFAQPPASDTAPYVTFCGT